MARFIYISCDLPHAKVRFRFPLHVETPGERNNSIHVLSLLEKFNALQLWVLSPSSGNRARLLEKNSLGWSILQFAENERVAVVRIKPPSPHGAS